MSGVAYFLFVALATSLSMIFSLDQSPKKCLPSQQLYAAMLYSKRSGSSDPRINKHVDNFTQLLLEHGVPNQSKSFAEVLHIPSVYSEACNQDKNAGGPFDKGHGSNLAHKQVWEYFHRHRRPCGLAQRDVMLVFEYDAFLGHPLAVDMAIESVHAMQTDFHFLGYCYKNSNLHPAKNGLAPYCLHAYAISLGGAKKLIDMVDTCSFFADAQVAILGDSKNITWSYVKQNYDKSYIDKYFFDNGIHISGPFLYDGVFVQAKFDQNLPPLKEGTVVNNKNRGRELHILQNGTWRYIPNMDAFNALGVSPKNVLQLSEWQFRKYPEGAMERKEIKKEKELK